MLPQERINKISFMRSLLHLLYSIIHTGIIHVGIAEMCITVHVK